MPRRRRYRVRWSQTGTQDLESIVEFIARDNISAASQVPEKLRKAASTLQTMPQRGRIVPELKEFGITIYREIISSPWRIIYRVSGVNIFVLAVIDSRRNVEDILLDRLIQ